MSTSSTPTPASAARSATSVGDAAIHRCVGGHTAAPSGPPGTGTLRRMKCPIDDSPLSVSSRDGVEIDFCPQCRGVWLDRGELDKIIDRAAAAIAGAAFPPPAASAPPPPPDDRRRDDRYRDDRDRYDRDDRRRRKRRNFLEDLFDFD